MPIYEFYCPDNHRIYSFFARSLAYAGKTPRCPDNPKHKMERMISSFSVTGRAKEQPDAPPGGEFDDAKMEAAMSQMEREFSSMDSENPDPRQLAHMMRRMTDLTGEKMPGQMEEMIRRMEAGEDPEKLEEEMGDVMGDEGPGGGTDEGSPAERAMRARLRGLRKRPVRDPVLYEMSEFVK
jgi:hypothetical protein